jgi:endonuclease YncB( thermonuclease family)
MEHIVYKDTIPYIPAIESGKVIKVYDGDTITIATKLPHDNEHVYRFSVRLRGIDCPEMRKADEKEKAILARDFVSQRIMHKMVVLKDIEIEKYGRILANVYYEGENISTSLLEANLAKKYGS